MTTNSINTNIAAYYAQGNIKNASMSTSSSVARLSSGNRIVRAADDVAALSAGTSLRTNVTTLRTALINTSQASSLLQVADGALSQVTEILQRQKAIAVQAGSGTLTASERSFLNQEFTNLTSEIDRLVDNTNFNGVKLLNGDLFDVTRITNRDTGAAQSLGSITLNQNVAAVSTANLFLNGVQIKIGTSTTAGVNDVLRGNTIEETLDNLVNFLNSSTDTRLSVATYTRNGNTLEVRQRAGGTLGQTYVIETSLERSTALSSTGQFNVGNSSSITISGINVADATTANAVTTNGGAGLFKAGNLTVQGTTVAITNGQTVQDVVNAINAATATTGVTATAQDDGATMSIILTRPTDTTLTLTNSENAGGDLTESTAAGTSTNIYSIANVSGNPTGYAYQQIWGFTITEAQINDSANAVVTTGGGAGVIKAGNLLINDQTGTARTVSVVNGDTLLGVVNKINAQSGVTGVTAKIIGMSGSYGIQLETSTQRDIGFTNNENGATDLFETRTTGALQKRSDKITVTGGNTLLNEDLITAVGGGGRFEAGKFIINGVEGATALTNGGGGDNIVEVMTALQTDFSWLTVTVEGDPAEADKFRFVLSTNDPTRQIRVNSLFAGGGTADLDGSATQAGGSANENNSVRLMELQGGDNNGLRRGATVATGTMGDSILTTLANTRAQVTMSFADIAVGDLSTSLNYNTIRFDTGDGMGGQQLTFTLVDSASISSTATVDDNIVRIGSTLGDTLDNIVSAINSYFDNAEVDSYAVRQVTARRQGREIILEYTGMGDFDTRAGLGTQASTVRLYTDIAQTVASVSAASTVTNPINLGGGGVNQYTSFNSGNATGVDASNVINADFAGTVKGFKAEYGGTPNRVNLSLTVGGVVYSASNVNTNYTSSTSTDVNTVRLLSEGGGYLDLQFAANQGSVVSTQAQADSFAARLDQAFSTITFYQNRQVTSYNGSGDIITNATTTGSLTGTSFELQNSSFENLQIKDVKVSAPPQGVTSGIIEFTINDEVFRSRADIGSKLAANGIYRFESVTNPNNVLTFRVGSTAIQFDTNEKATSFESALKGAFGIGAGGESLKFQVGVTTSDTLSVRIDAVATETLFDGKSLNVLTQQAAAEAADQLDKAIGIVTGVRANVGALQSRFNFAAANIESSIQNQDAARGVLLDTDIAAESTAYATNQVKLQAGISVLAQANQQLQSLLKLIG